MTSSTIPPLAVSIVKMIVKAEAERGYSLTPVETAAIVATVLREEVVVGIIRSLTSSGRDALRKVIELGARAYTEAGGRVSREELEREDIAQKMLVIGAAVVAVETMRAAALRTGRVAPTGRTGTFLAGA